ncbi:ANK [Seminavis robusta]|uniref:ANK n=1 Tax=Seminavis robusta TaxID=568900 RepID=A0A9N8EM63_9STRA|nr:ANK [Seminavis robusta]|eukprot:Sro1392_g268830.1 ANK (353) ;mRNA; r:10625-11683
MMMKDSSSKSLLSKADQSQCSSKATIATASMSEFDDMSDNDTLGDDLDDLDKELLNFRSGRATVNKRDSVRPGSLSPALLRRRPRKITASGSLSPKGRPQAGPGFSRSNTVMTPQERRRRMPSVNTDLDDDLLGDSSKTNAVVVDETPATSPDECLQELLQGICATTLQSEFWEAYFTPVTDARLKAHSLKVSHAIRKNRFPTLKELHHKGMSLNGCNSHGESMIHLACRLGRQEIVEFMIGGPAQVSLRVQDDTGRTPLHDVCWTNKPNFDLIKVILEQCPELLFVQDKRGYTALRYIPPSCWKVWCDWLVQEQAWIKLKVKDSGFAHTRDVLDDAQQRLQKLLQRAEEFQ